MEGQKLKTPYLVRIAFFTCGLGKLPTLKFKRDTGARNSQISHSMFRG